MGIFLSSARLGRADILATLLLLFTSPFLQKVLAQQAPVRIDIAPWLATMSTGGPVALELTIHNDSTVPAVLNLGEDEKEGVSIVALSANHDEYQSAWRAKDGLFQIGVITVAPGSEIHQQIILQDWNLHLKPGVYAISVSFKYKAKLGQIPDLTLPLVRTSIDLVDGDSQVTKDACEKASNLYIDAQDSANALAAASLLAHFNNERALTCLTETYYAKSLYHFEYLIIRAIGNIGSTRAISALTTIASGANTEDAQIAENVIQRAKIKNKVDVH